WHYGHVWLVFGGPAAVVVACMITIVIAVKGQDPIIDQDYYRHCTEINKSLAAEKSAKVKKTVDIETIEQRNALEPAMRARNHAATGVNQTN
nr:FixH family protein [Methylotenera sp.]